MTLPQEGCLLRLFMGEDDKHDGKPLYEWLVLEARARGQPRTLCLPVASATDRARSTRRPARTTTWPPSGSRPATLSPRRISAPASAAARNSASSSVNLESPMAGNGRGAVAARRPAARRSVETRAAPRRAAR